MDDTDLVLNIPEELYEALSRRREANGRTPDEEARATLIAAVQTDPDLAS